MTKIDVQVNYAVFHTDNDEAKDLLNSPKPTQTTSLKFWITTPSSAWYDTKLKYKEIYFFKEEKGRRRKRHLKNNRGSKGGKPGEKGNQKLKINGVRQYEG